MVEGWRINEAGEVVDPEDKLFNLEAQLVVLAQTMLHSSEEEHTLSTLQWKEEKLMRQAEMLQRKIDEA